MSWDEKKFNNIYIDNFIKLKIDSIQLSLNLARDLGYNELILYSNATRFSLHPIFTISLFLFKPDIVLSLDSFAKLTESQRKSFFIDAYKQGKVINIESDPIIIMRPYEITQ